MCVWLRIRRQRLSLVDSSPCFRQGHTYLERQCDWVIGNGRHTSIIPHDVEVSKMLISKGLLNFGLRGRPTPLSVSILWRTGHLLTHVLIQLRETNRQFSCVSVALFRARINGCAQCFTAAGMKCKTVSHKIVSTLGTLRPPPSTNYHGQAPMILTQPIRRACAFFS